MIEFSKLSENARIWVYTSNRFLTEQEKEVIHSKGYDFLSTWSAHGDKLHAGMDILDNCFLCIGVDQDQTSASGCSIDASVSFLQSLEKELNVTLLDWQNMAYQKDGKIALTKRSDFENALKNGSLHTDIQVFQTNLTIKSDLQQNRTIDVSESNFKNLIPIKS